MNCSTNTEIIQKRNRRNQETDEQRTKRLAREQELKRQKRARETEQQHEEHLQSENQRRQAARKQSRKLKNRNVLTGRNINQQTRQDHERREIEETYLENDNTDSDSQPTPHSATTLSEEEISMLQDFRLKMDNINYNLCIVCQERIPLLTLVKGTCKRCYYEKNIGGTPKKFSEGNNMHPGEVPNELKGLSEIEEMLISQVFTVMTVYRLRGGQNGYRGHRQSSNNPTVFRDFTVRRRKVCKALLWLKENNPYYNDIIIDTNLLETLPENDSIFNMLPQLQDDELGEDDGDNIEDGEDVSRMFVPSMPPTQREGEAINTTLDRMQNDNPPSLWPEIEGVPINEFHTPGYMVRAFPTLYPYGRADLCSARVKEVKPAEYFRHLLWYKDGRFARHPRWRYFALNSSMRWRALQEGQIYVKQNLKEEQINVLDIQEMIANGDKNIADRIMRYGEGLRGTRQFWIARRKELLDFIKQIGADGLIFFTFSTADMHWPELHKLMENCDHNGDEAESSKRRQQNIIDNPHIATWFFKQKFETFFKDVLVKRWELEDYWYRY
ncbi:unnamed protein product [Rhizophagus irregularis]|nr:unnamed protein product [Rhizophagus irregularis]